MLSIMALSGRSSLVFTTRHHLAPGMAPSRANAQVQREAAVVQPMPHMMASTISGIRSAMAPSADPTASLIMVGTGCPLFSAFSISISGSTKTSGMRKTSPAKRLRITVPTMALGTCVAGLCTSSHMEIIMPVDEVAYPPCSSPTQNDHPSGQPDWVSKCPKTYSPEWRPPLASTRTATMMAMTPAKVQKMAAV